MVHLQAFWGLARQQRATDNDEWGLCTHRAFCFPSSAENTDLFTFSLCLSPYRKAPCLCLPAIKSKANGRIWPGEVIKWKKLVPQCVQVTFSAHLKHWPYHTYEYVSTHALCVRVIYLPTALRTAQSLVSCADVWFVYVSVFMHKCSMCVDLCLNSQLLKVPHLATCSFFTHWDACYTH